MHIDDEALMALADGELSEIDSARITEALRADSKLQARFDVFVKTRALLAQMSHSGAADPRDAQLIKKVNAARRPVRDSNTYFRAKQGGEVGWFGRRRPVAANSNWRPYAAAVAIAAVAIITFGWQLDQKGGGPEANLSKAVIAALEGTPSGEAALDGELVVIASYYLADGSFCREYQQEDQGYDAVLACYDGEGWRQQLAVVAVDREGYMPASDASELIDDFLRNSGAGLPLTLEDEMAALSALGGGAS